MTAPKKTPAPAPLPNSAHYVSSVIASLFVGLMAIIMLMNMAGF